MMEISVNDFLNIVILARFESSRSLVQIGLAKFEKNKFLETTQCYKTELRETQNLNCL